MTAGTCRPLRGARSDMTGVPTRTVPLTCPTEEDQ